MKLRLSIALVFLALGCRGGLEAAGEAAHLAEREAYDAAQRAAVSDWAGVYRFSDGSRQIAVTIERDGSAAMVLDSGRESRRIIARGSIRENTLTLQFRSYADEAWYSGAIPDFTFGLGPDFKPGQRLVTLVREGDRSVSLRFVDLKSSSGAEKLYAGR